MRSLCIGEVGGVKMKKKWKKCVLQFEQTNFLYYSLLAVPLALNFKDDF
jgi:hypothetical protein